MDFACYGNIAIQLLKQLRLSATKIVYPITLFWLGLCIGCAPGDKPAQSKAIWIAVDDGIVKVDTENGSESQYSNHAAGIHHLTVDAKHNRLLAAGPGLLVSDHLDKALDGTDSKIANVGAHKIFNDMESGRLWIIEGNSLSSFDHQLEHLTGPTQLPGLSKEAVIGLVVANNITTVAQDNVIHTFAPDGTSIFTSQQNELVGLAHDESAGHRWGVGSNSITLFPSDGGSSYSLNQGGDFFAIDGNGGLWLAQGANIYHVVVIDNTIHEAYSASLQSFGFGNVKHMVADVSNQSIWVLADNMLLNIDTTGTIQKQFTLRTIAANDAVHHISHYADIYPPRIDIIEPTEQAAIQDITLKFTASDEGRGIDPESTHVTLDGAELDVNCTIGGETVSCPLGVVQNGGHSIEVTVSDKAGNLSEVAMREFTVASMPLELNVSTPANNLYTNQPSISVLGEVNRPATITVNGESTERDGLSYSSLVNLTEGVNTIRVRAIAGTNQSREIVLTVTLDTQAPESPDSSRISLDHSQGITTLVGQAGSVESGASLIVTNTRTGISITQAASPNGSFSAQLDGIQSDTYSIVARDAAGNVSASIYVGSGLPPDPSHIAPALDPTVATGFHQATEFLYAGSNPIQRDVVPGAIDPARVSVLKGRVSDRNGSPIPDVSITIHHNDQYGYTKTRADGQFDIAINGGGIATINYDKAGYLPVQRKVTALQKQYSFAESIVMIQVDAMVTTINMGATSGMQVATSSMVTDSDGSRQAILMVPNNTTANMVMPDGSTQSISTLNIRATEYTVGERGPNTMPGELPPASAYTYAVELSADEVIASGATSLEFNQPVYMYVDNFLSFPVGGIVPTGYYDRDKASWIASENGLIILILSISNGLAALDINGSGTPASDAQLSALNITSDELSRLASTYSAGKSLWRVPIRHFTPWDCNWPFGPPSGASRPNADIDASSTSTENKPDCKKGSIIECQSQVLGEKLNIFDTPYTLSYRSDRVPGYQTNRIVKLNLTGATIDPDILDIKLEVTVAGRLFEYSFAPEPNLQYEFFWDGMDGYGRELHSQQNARIRVGYTYPGLYREPAQMRQSFMQWGWGVISGDRDRTEVTIWQDLDAVILGSQLAPKTLGGWTINAHHSYDIEKVRLHRGDGKTISADMQFRKMAYRFAGTGASGFGGDGGPAQGAVFNRPLGIVIGPDNAIYIADEFNHRIRRIDPSGIIQTIAGTGQGGHSGDGGPAVNARLRQPRTLAFGPDGSLFFTQHAVIRRIDPNGIISTVAGRYYDEEQAPASGNGGPAIDAVFTMPFGLAVGQDGTLYVADGVNSTIRQVAPGGIVQQVAGTGIAGYSGDGGPARDAQLRLPTSLAIGPNGYLYIADTGNNRIRMIDNSGTISTFAGTGETNLSIIFNGELLGDGGPARLARIFFPTNFTFDNHGNMFLSDFSGLIRRISSDGIISTYAGTRHNHIESEYGGTRTDNQLSMLAGFELQASLAIGNDDLYILENLEGMIWRVSTPFVELPEGAYAIASADGSQVYVFDGFGRHMRTVDSKSGNVIHEFGYENGRLTQIRDRYAATTSLNYDTSGVVTITSPDAKTTRLEFNGDGYIGRIEYSSGATYGIQYAGSNGLLEHFTNPELHTTDYQYYPGVGLFQSSTNAAGEGWTAVRTPLADGHQVAMTDREGLASLYQVRNYVDGQSEGIRIFPDGTSSTRRVAIDGTETEVDVDGMMTVRRLSAGPRFGMSSPMPSEISVTSPLGRTHVTSITRAVTESATDPLLGVEDFSESLSFNNRVFSRRFTSINNQWTVTSPEQREYSVTLDDHDMPRLMQIPGFTDIHYLFDDRGRIDYFAFGSGAEERRTDFAYYQDGFRKGWVHEIIRADTRRVIYDYYPSGLLRTATLPGSRTINYDWYEDGKLRSIQPPGRPAHHFYYDSDNKMTGYRPPALDANPTTNSYFYNLSGKLRLVSKPGGVEAEWIYNPVSGKLDRVEVGHGYYDYVYDPATGRIDTINAPGGTSLTLDFDGMLPTGESWSGGISGTVQTGYDNNFWISSQTVNGNSLAYGYDDDGLLTSAGNLVVARDPDNGLIIGTTLGNVLSMVDPNAFGELESSNFQYQSTVLFREHIIERDKLGRITIKDEMIGGITTRYEYGYNDSDYLHTVRRNGTLVSTYTYGANGNRESYNGTTTVFDEQDRMTGFGATGYTYTPAGDLQTKTVGTAITRYDYDIFSNLLRVELPDNRVIDYVIDGKNRRIGKHINGNLVQGFLYQDVIRPIAELNAQGAVVSRFVYGDKFNSPAYMIRGGATYRIISDYLGSPRLVVNVASGAIAQRMDYDEFGNVTQDTNPGFQPFGFAGGLYDRDTGLIRFGARDYDPHTARWTTKDPIGLAGDMNIYAYAVNNPLFWIDPDGLEVITVDPYGHDWTDVIRANPGLAGTSNDSILLDGVGGNDQIWVNKDVCIVCPDGTKHIVDSLPGSTNLSEVKGAQLEEWKKQHPDAEELYCD